MEIDLLGAFAVRVEGGQVDPRAFGGRLVRRLVRILAAHRGLVVSRDALIEALWGEQAPADPGANLNVLVNRARRGLGDPAVIDTAAGGYVLRPGPDVVVDVETFDACVGRARDALDRGEASVALSSAEDALALWSGEPLPEDADAQWARGLRDRLERAFQETLEVGAAAALRTGALRRAADLAAQAVAHEPLREAAHVLLIRALADGGDQAAALVAYGRLRRTLAEELGIDPSRTAADLHRRLLRDEYEGEPVRHPPLAEATPLVGRDHELAALCAVGRDWPVGLVAGRSGSGKSRLLGEFTRRADRTTLSARAVLPEREAPWSLARVLLEAAVDAGIDVPALLPPHTMACVAELLPDLEGERVTVDPQTWRALLVQGAVLILEAAGSMLVVDDLQWADSSSLEVLALLAARGEGPGMVLAYRPEEIDSGSPTERFLAELRTTTRPVELALQRLDAGAIGRLVASPAMASALAQHTDGTPYAVLEVLRDLARDDVVVRDPAGTWQVTTSPHATDRARTAARAGQQRSIWVRIQRHPHGRRQLLGLLALLGRPASVKLLSSATGTAADDVLAGLAELVRTELIAHDRSGFAVAHDLVGETMRDRLDAVERVGLHQLLARALAEEAAPPDERARHLAGAGDVPAACAAYVRAAARRLDDFADQEAEHLAGEGLGLDPSSPRRGALLEIRAEARARRGDFPAAREDLRTALALVAPGPDRARLLTRLAALASGTEDMLRASNLVDMALAEAIGDPGAKAQALYVAALVDMNLERPQRAEERFAEALSLFSTVGDSRGIADILDARAMARCLDGDIDGAVTAFDRVARVFEDSGNLLRVVTPRSTRGHNLVFAGQPAAGLADVDAALEVARSLGYAEGEAMALWHRSEALVACGQATQGADAADTALSIARRVGHRGWTATALRARGIALVALDDLAAAEDAFRQSLEASDHLPLFAAWAHARLALLYVRRNRLAQAAPHADAALRTGPPLAHYEARLARCEIAVTRSEPDAAALIAQAQQKALAGGHRSSHARLMQLGHAANRRDTDVLTRQARLDKPASI